MGGKKKTKSYGKTDDQYGLGHYLGEDTGGKPLPPKCHTKHPTLKLAGGEILGASCHSPVPGYDVYLGLDRGMYMAKAPYPWEEKPQVVQVLFPVKDMDVPESATDFRAMVEWTCTQLQAGKRVHVGCMGGHGRTGMFLAALVKVATGEEHAIGWVRKHYCQKAVETTLQADWLVKHFGVAPAKGYKSENILSLDSGSGGSYSPAASYSTGAKWVGGSVTSPSQPALFTGSQGNVLTPATSKKSIWKK